MTALARVDMQSDPPSDDGECKCKTPQIRQNLRGFSGVQLQRGVRSEAWRDKRGADRPACLAPFIPSSRPADAQASICPAGRSFLPSPPSGSLPPSRLSRPVHRAPRSGLPSTLTSVTTLTKSASRSLRGARSPSMATHLENAIRSRLVDGTPMAAIARELSISVREVKKVRGKMEIKSEIDLEEKRRQAELYVLSRVGKCTDGFEEVESEAYILFDELRYTQRRETNPWKSYYIPKLERN